ncbi:MAG: hypothetical protein ACKOWF_13520 [Chloroflexota bacterium]
MDRNTPIARAIAETIAAQSGQDPAFVDRFLADPAGTLEPFGVAPAWAIQAAVELRAETSADGDVAGYLAKPKPKPKPVTCKATNVCIMTVC